MAKYPEIVQKNEYCRTSRHISALTCLFPKLSETGGMLHHKQIGNLRSLYILHCRGKDWECQWERKTNSCCDALGAFHSIFLFTIHSLFTVNNLQHIPIRHKTQHCHSNSDRACTGQKASPGDTIQPWKWFISCNQDIFYMLRYGFICVDMYRFYP